MKKVGKFRIVVFSAVVVAILFSGIHTSDYYARSLLDENIYLNKVGSPTSYSAVGDVIEYSYIVKNKNGSIFLENIVVKDDLIDNINCPEDELHKGEKIICTGSYTITEEDIEAGEVTNYATVDGTYLDRAGYFCNVNGRA